MRALRSWLAVRLVVITLTSLALAPADAGEPPARTRMPLQLEVSINGGNIGLLGSFELLGDGRIAATSRELESLGLRVPPHRDAAVIPLDEIVGLTYTYDSSRQVIDLKVSDAQRQAREIGPSSREPSPPSDRQLIGTVINYGLVGALYPASNQASVAPNAGLPRQLQSLSLDTRIFGPLGTFSNTGFIGSGLANDDPIVRLDSTWSWSDPKTLRTWRLGDVVTRGPAWARPVRLGGGQVQTNFSLRPDLVTAPLPSFHGSAAVPSAVDVFINSTKVYSQTVEPGPFVISNLPAVTGAGGARIVVRDAAGRETVQTSSFYTTPVLLRAGLFDYSIEGGLVRGNYGIVSNDYDDRPIGSASARYGLTDAMTLEGHGEFGAGLVNGGSGISFTVLDRSLLSLAVSASSHQGDVGVQGYAAIETGFGPATLRVSTQRTLGTYKDLASVVRPSPVFTAFVMPGISAASLAPPKILDIATLSFALPERSGSIGLSVINRVAEDRSSRILTGSYSRPLLESAALFVSGFHDLTTRSTGLFAGLSVPLGDKGHGQLGVSHNGGRSGLTADYAKPAAREPGSVGWRMTTREGDVPSRSAAATYQTSIARIEAGVEQLVGRTGGRAVIDGAVVATSSGTFLANKVDDAFAIVEAGAPGVDVLLENRKVAVTNGDGRALVPGLRSYQRNKIAIDPDKLPSDTSVDQLDAHAIPGDRNGVAVSLKTVRAADSAVVVFRDANGAFVPAGARGVIAETGRSFVVGYDGRAFIEGLERENQVMIAVAEKSCAAFFGFRQQPGPQPTIDNVTCN